jgi:DNA adenine methylase
MSPGLALQPHTAANTANSPAPLLIMRPPALSPALMRGRRFFARGALAREARAMRLPHPIPYQGSKRALAASILAAVEGRRFRRLYEPFAGSGALTLAAASRQIATHYVLSDSLAPLAALWRRLLADPAGLARDYAALWRAQARAADFYERVRDRFNRTRAPEALLYLLARCVKASPRFNRAGEFNQSPDRRRLGMSPERMARELAGAAALLAGRAEVRCTDFADALADAAPGDLVYLDPPWQGTTLGRDKRYHAGLSRERLVAVVEALRRRGIALLLSYDGRTGVREYGEPLPAQLGMRRLELVAGRSAQATLLGRDRVTVESLYVALEAPSKRIALAF